MTRHEQFEAFRIIMNMLFLIANMINNTASYPFKREWDTVDYERRAFLKEE